MQDHSSQYNPTQIGLLLDEILANQEEINVRLGTINSNIQTLKNKISKSDQELIKLNVVIGDLKSSVATLEEMGETFEAIQMKLNR